MAGYDVDLFVIGAGSGGVRAARMAAGLGIRVAIAENRYIGGTCVNAGCIPKKLFVYASHFREDFVVAKGFGWSVQEPVFDWSRLLSNKNAEINRLQTVYESLLENSQVQVITGQAQIVDTHTVKVGEQQFSCERILVATGSWPSIPDFPGSEFVVSSNEMFKLDKLPQQILIVGGGYIAVEFAGIMHGLGVDTTLCYRGKQLLRSFDADLGEFVTTEMRKKAVDIRLSTNIHRIEKTAEGFIAYAEGEQTIHADLVLYATGRKPNTQGLGLQKLGVELDKNGAIRVDADYQTNIPSIYALGDVTNRVNLTPVATAEAMALVKKLYKGLSVPVDYDNIPTAVFSQPNIGTVGLTEAEARKRHANIDIYKSVFTPLKQTLAGSGEKTMMKLVVNRDTDKVLGVHMVGSEAGEIIQGMAIAIRAGATKAIFDSTIGIHPTLAEEFVTMRTPV